MPAEEQKSFLEEINSIYGDTNYFIDAITEEYGFYGFFIEAMRAGSASVSINRKLISKRIEENWMSAIEACLPTIDYVTRNYSVYIEECEEIVPVELSRKVTNRAVRHLAQHTDYIKEVKDDTVIPSKILNVYNEETALTYENKFLNTLIRNLYSFVEKRYNVLAGDRLDESGVSVEFDNSFSFGSADGKLSLKIEVDDPRIAKDADKTLARLKKIRNTILGYLDSPFVKRMGNNYIRPPVMRTNAIMKNKYLRECIDLWDFIESYEGLGYVIDTEEQAEKPKEEFIKQIYSLMSLQYLMFDYNIHHGYRDMPEVVAARHSDKPFSPRLLTHFKKVETKDYNSYDTDFRKVVNISDFEKKRRPTVGETQIREAIEDALAVERELTIAQKRK